MSSKTGGLLSHLHHAPTVRYLPECPYGCGEMLELTDGFYCPICNHYRSPRRR
jgi:hypothetical protein